MKVTVAVEGPDGVTSRSAELDLTDMYSHHAYHAARIGHELARTVAEILGDPDPVPAEVVDAPRCALRAEPGLCAAGTGLDGWHAG